MNGLHLIADLLDCRCPADFLFAALPLEAFCVAACSRNGLTVVGRLFHAFRDSAGNPAGVTGTVVLAESHLAVHTWPEIAGVTWHLCASLRAATGKAAKLRAINVRVTDKHAVATAAAVTEAVSAAAAELGDGGRILLRPSGTEQLVRVMVEAPTPDLAHTIAARVADVVETAGA